jgi:hypothetical protein
MVIEAVIYFYHFQMVTPLYSLCFTVGNRRFDSGRRKLHAIFIPLRLTEVRKFTFMPQYATTLCVVPTTECVKWLDVVLHTRIPKVPASRMNPDCVTSEARPGRDADHSPPSGAEVKKE